MLSLPSTVLLRQRVPKKKLYEHLRLTGSARDQFVGDIDRLEIVAAIRESRIHIPAGEGVEEIDVLALRLREGAPIPEGAIAAIEQTSKTRKLLYACVDGSDVRLGVMRGELFWTNPEPLEDAEVELRGGTLDEVWDSLCSQVVLGDPDPTDLDGRLRRRRELSAARASLARLQRRFESERQIGRRNELWDQIRSIKNKIRELEAS